MVQFINAILDEGKIKKDLLYISRYSMSVGEIIMDPISILQMTSYFEKNIPKGRGGATYGFIYAKQVELKFLISLTAPLGTHIESV